MIAKFLYPKELKEIIADLRAKDDLNEQPLKRRERVIIFSLCFGIVAVVLMLILHAYIETEYHQKIFTVIILPLIILSLYMNEYGLCKEYAKLYSYGHITSATSRKNRAFLSLKGYMLEVSFRLDNGKEITSHAKIPDDAYGLVMFDKRFRRGKKVTICYDPENPKKSAVLTKKMASLFYLRKTPPAIPPS